MDARRELAQAFYLDGSDEEGCLLLHGFSGTPGHMRHLGEKLHANGLTVSAPLLPGHGTTLDEMEKSNFHQWLSAAQLAYMNLQNTCARVNVIGHSMGGALALILAEQYPVDGLICLAPAVKIRSRFAFASRPISAIVPRIMKRASEGSRGDFLDEYDCAYGGMPTRKVYDLRRLIMLATSNLFAIVAPTLIFQPLSDKTVNPKGAQMLYDGISSREKELIWLKDSDHILTLGPEREQIAQRIFEFIIHKQDANLLAK